MDIDISYKESFETEEDNIKLPVFKDFLQEDIDSTFFNTDEFAEIHSINNNDTLIIIGDIKMQEYYNRFQSLNELYEKFILFYVKKIDLGFLPKLNSNIFFDGELYQVANVSEENEVYVITLGKNIAR